MWEFLFAWNDSLKIVFSPIWSIGMLLSSHQNFYVVSNVSCVASYLSVSFSKIHSNKIAINMLKILVITKNSIFQISGASPRPQSIYVKPTLYANYDQGPYFDLFFKAHISNIFYSLYICKYSKYLFTSCVCTYFIFLFSLCVRIVQSKFPDVSQMTD